MYFLNIEEYLDRNYISPLLLEYRFTIKQLTLPTLLVVMTTKLPVNSVKSTQMVLEYRSAHSKAKLTLLKRFRLKTK